MSSSLPMHQRRSGSTGSTTGSGNGHFGNNNSMYGRQGSGGYNPSHLESGRSSRGGMSASDTNANIMEQQNNERLSELGDQVELLKGLTIDIGNEVREQNRSLDDMGDTFSATRDMLTGSLQRIGTMLESGGAKHMCYMVAFVVGVMVFLYWLMTYKGTSGA